MKEKKCSKCKANKNVNEFYKREGGRLRSHCKECMGEQSKNRKIWRGKEYLDHQRRYRASFKDGYYSVYYLPEEHYVGMTNNVKSRMDYHKSNGKITEGLEIIAKFERAVDAHLFETMLHQRDYNGFHYRG